MINPESPPGPLITERSAGKSGTGHPLGQSGAHRRSPDGQAAVFANWQPARQYIPPSSEIPPSRRLLHPAVSFVPGRLQRIETETSLAQSPYAVNRVSQIINSTKTQQIKQIQGKSSLLKASNHEPNPSPSFLPCSLSAFQTAYASSSPAARKSCIVNRKSPKSPTN